MDDFASGRALSTGSSGIFQAPGRRNSTPAAPCLRSDMAKSVTNPYLISRTELEAAVFRRLVEHLRSRSDVQNIDLMNLAGFCRNCLSNWLKEEADASGVPMSKDESREAVYGMPYETWKTTYQGAASSEQLAAMKKSHSGH
jgi:hypothetical protein